GPEFLHGSDRLGLGRARLPVAVVHLYELRRPALFQHHVLRCVSRVAVSAPTPAPTAAGASPPSTGAGPDRSIAAAVPPRYASTTSGSFCTRSGGPDAMTFPS